jgi:hypothetical protein
MSVQHFSLLSHPAQDYGKHGVTDMEDKQKLFRLIKRMAQPEFAMDLAKAVPSASPAVGAHGADLLDLDEVDENLIDLVSASILDGLHRVGSKELNRPL